LTWSGLKNFKGRGVAETMTTQKINKKKLNNNSGPEAKHTTLKIVYSNLRLSSSIRFEGGTQI
jgi:hypothetical protein